MGNRKPATYVADARRAIARNFRTLSVFGQHQSVALYNYVAVLEVETLKTVISQGDPKIDGHLAHRRAVESSAFAIPAIFKYCSRDTSPSIAIDKEAFEQAWELYNFSYKYEAVEYAFGLADKGQFEIFVATNDPRITFSYASSTADEKDTLIRARELHALFSGERLSLDHDETAQCFSQLKQELQSRIRLIGPESCDYAYDEDLLFLMRELGAALVKSVPTEMDPEVSVDIISFGQLRNFWGALLAMSNTHFLAHTLASGGDVGNFPIQTLVLCKTRNQTREWIARISQLSVGQVDRIIDWYTYDPRVAGRVPILQPLLPVGGGALCLPFSFVNGNNFERNFFKLLHRHPKLILFAAGVESWKEPIALKQLAGLFPSPKYRTEDRVNIPGRTDADLLAYEFETGFALVIQHKWLADPDTLGESATNDESIRKGMKQAVTARDYFRSNDFALRRALRLSENNPICQIEAVMVCRGLEATGFQEVSIVPAISELAFRGLLKESRSLGEFWRRLNSRTDQTRAAKQIRDVQNSVQLCGYEFVLPALLIHA